MESNADQVDINVGELMALKAMCIALISTHSDPDELQRVFADATDHIVDRMLMNPSVPQKSIEALREMTHAINETIRRRTLRQPQPNHGRSA